MPRTADPYQELSRRERQIMDAVYRLGRASVTEVLGELPDPPSYSAVRAMIGKLEEKGHLRHLQDGPRYLYLPTRPREEATENALERVLRTFFDGSPARAVAAVLDMGGEELTREELDDIAARIEQARRRGR